ncbi:membrane-binding protein [Capnocytophaga catalasegens]|nr:membrane-binding protein [Capnocytophaga catalasegens]
MAKSYSEKIIATKLMIDGIKEHKDSLPHGVSIDIATKMEELRSKIETLNSEQESLKAELKRKTDTITKEFQELDKIYNDAKKRIKLDVEQTLWRKFGIEDKK